MPSGADPMRRAYVDESESHRQLDPDVYILASALVEESQTERVRELLAALRPTGHSKLHWHAESNRSRRMITATIVKAPVIHVVVVRTGRPGESTERRRRKCLQRLAYELGDRGVRQITAEAREPKANARELQYFNRLRATHLMPVDMRLHHATGPAEPLLWIPDAVAGAVTAARTGSTEHLDELGDLLDIVMIDADS